MIEVCIYAIRDNGAEFFIQPFTAPTDTVAQRMFIGSLGDSFPHRQDFALYRCGIFNTQTGCIESQDPELVLNGLSIPEKFDPRLPAANAKGTQS